MDCLSEETLFDLARGKLSGERLEAALAHVAGCADCAALLAHAAPALEAAPGITVNSVVETAGPGRAQRPAPPASLKLGGEVRGTYRVVRQIGRGGMGVVYEVSHARLAGRYALKLMSPEFAADEAALSRFRREAQVTSSLRHPNIVQVIDFDQTDDGRPFLAMEFLDGPTLAHHLESHGPLPLPAAIAIIRQIADALEAAHKAGVVHRDLKPENVVLVRQDEERFLVKLLDFGLSKMRAGSLRITGSSALLGTPTYMTPEQAMGEVDRVDGRTDQYALGTLAWEILLGKPPFRGDSVHAVLYQIIHQPPPAVKDLAPGVERVLRRALAKDPDQRFPSVAAFAEALVRAADENPSAPPIVRGPPEAAKGRGRVWIAAAGVVGVSVTALALWRPGGRQGPAAPVMERPAPAVVMVKTDAAAVAVAVPDAAPAVVPASPPRPAAKVKRPKAAPVPAPPEPAAAATAIPPPPADAPPDAAPVPRKDEFPRPVREL